jgi:lipoate-protein ligase A
MVWLGRHLAAVFAAALPQHSFSVHEGPAVTTSWSSLVCFDGVGAGEVLLDGRKLVGISQRRTRDAARLQCCWYTAHDPDDLMGLLAAARRPDPGALAPVATVTAAVAAVVPGALVARL